MKLASLTLFISIFSGCSVYESAGKKFLENTAYQWAGISALSHLSGCNRDAPTADKRWELGDVYPDARLFTTEEPTNNFVLRVQPTEDPKFNCYYNFSSAQDLYSQERAAIDLSLSQLNAEMVPPTTQPKAR